MYQSIPSVTNPKANFQVQTNPGPLGKFSGQIPGAGFSETLYFNKFQIFYHSQGLNHQLSTEYLQIRMENIKNMQKSF